MRVLHVLAGRRWTGVGATALQLVEALHAAGVEVDFLFQRGNNLAGRLAGKSWAHPSLCKERSLAELASNLRAIRARAVGADLVHAHLPHDHALARVALRGTRHPLVRSVRRHPHLRASPYHRWLFRGCRAVGVAHAELLGLCDRLPALAGVPRIVLPIALEPRFRPATDLDATRAALGIPAGTVVAGTVGKVDRGRGQDLFLRALAAAPGVWGLIVGTGDAEPAARTLARQLEVETRVVFAGYVESGLETLYRAMDLFVFPAAGSDHGHRAIAEASGCGIPTLAADVPGVRELVEPGATGALYPREDAAALALLIREWARHAEHRRDAGRTAATRAAASWTPHRLAAAAIAMYDAARTGHGP
ncbi:MAG: glycosyltransferase family 4 protein [Acidobacteriota bacterium]